MTQLQIDVRFVKREPQGGGQNRDVEDDDDGEGEGGHADSKGVRLFDDAGADLRDDVERVDGDDGVVDAADLAHELHDAEVAVERVHVAVLALVVESDGQQNGGGAKEDSLSDLQNDSVCFCYFLRV